MDKMGQQKVWVWILIFLNEATFWDWFAVQQGNIYHIILGLQPRDKAVMFLGSIQ